MLVHNIGWVTHNVPIIALFAEDLSIGITSPLVILIGTNTIWAIAKSYLAKVILRQLPTTAETQHYRHCDHSERSRYHHHR